MDCLAVSKKGWAQTGSQPFLRVPLFALNESLTSTSSVLVVPVHFSSVNH